MDWKKENKRNRYIDSITNDEAYHISNLAAGQPSDFKIIDIKRSVNGNNIPHVEIHYKYFETCICDYIDDYVGIFHNLNIYIGEHFKSVYCQKEIFDYFKEIKID